MENQIVFSKPQENESNFVNKKNKLSYRNKILLVILASIVLFLSLLLACSFKTVPSVSGTVMNALSGDPLEGIDITQIIFVNEGYRPKKMLRFVSPIGYYGGYHDLKEKELSTKTNKNGQFRFDSFKIFQFPFLDKVEKKGGLYANVKVDELRAFKTNLIDNNYTGALLYPSALSIPGHSIMAFPEKEKNYISKMDGYYLDSKNNIEIKLYPAVESPELCKNDLFCINFNQYNFLCNKNLYEICENNNYEKDNKVKDHCYFIAAILSKNKYYCKNITNQGYLDRCLLAVLNPETYPAKTDIPNAMGYIPDIFLDSCKKAINDAENNI